MGRPIVTLNGHDTILIYVGEEFADPGATAEDEDGNPLPVQVAGHVDTHHQSTHTLIYSAYDDAGGYAQAMRTVCVGRDRTIC